MSFKAFISYEGYIRFEEYHPIDYARLHRKLGPDVSAKLQYLLQSKIPILNPNLLRRCKNAKKYHVNNKAQAVARGIAFGLASGLTYGLTDLAFAKSFPRFKEKHLPAVKELLLAEVVKCGFNPSTIVVVNQLEGDNDLEGIPDLVPDYQFWILYIKHEFPRVDFPNFQKLEDIRHQLKLERIAAEKARVDAVGNSGAVGIYKTMQANKRAKQHTANADALVNEWVELQKELADAGKLPRDYQDDPTVIDSIGNSQIDVGYQAQTATIPETEEEEIDVGPQTPYGTAPYQTEQRYEAAPPAPNEQYYDPDSPAQSSGNVVTTTYHVPPPQPEQSSGNVVTTTYHEPPPGAGNQMTTTTYTIPAPNAPEPQAQGPVVAPLADRKARKEALADFNVKAKAFFQKLKQLIKTMEQDHMATLKQRLARQEVAREFFFWVSDSPLQQFGEGLEGFSNTFNEVETQGTAYENECNALIQQTETLYQAVADEVSSMSKKGREMTNALEHYESKVESLRAQYTRVVSTRGREGAYTINERLHRNEDKLTQAQANYKDFEQELARCNELLDSAWVVVCPLIVQSFRAESDDAEKRSEIKKKLNARMNAIQSFVQGPVIPIAESTPQEVWNHMQQNGPSSVVQSMQGLPSIAQGGTIITEEEIVHDDVDSTKHEEDYYQCAQFSLIEVPESYGEEETEEESVRVPSWRDSDVVPPLRDTNFNYIRNNRRDPTEISLNPPVYTDSGGDGSEPGQEIGARDEQGIVGGGTKYPGRAKIPSSRRDPTEISLHPPVYNGNGAAATAVDSNEGIYQPAEDVKEPEIVVGSGTNYNIKTTSSPQVAVAIPHENIVGQILDDDGVNSEPEIVVGRFQEPSVGMNVRDDGLVTEPGFLGRNQEPDKVAKPSSYHSTRSPATVTGSVRRRGADPPES